MRFELGQRVEFNATVEKEKDDEGVTWKRAPLPKKTSYRHDENKEWVAHVRTISEGVIVGYRNLTDYAFTVEVEHDDMWGQLYSHTSVSPVSGTSRLAWLIAYDLRRKPVLVLDEDVKPLKV